MGKRKYFLVLDVEATRPCHVYDIGIAIIDRHCNIYHTESFVVKDIFSDLQDMSSAYYKSKIPKYLDSLYCKEHIPEQFFAIREIALGLIEQYEIDTVCAYNVSYDVRVLNTTIAYLTKGRITEYFPEHINFWDIYTMACQVIATQKNYIKTAIREGWISSKGNMQVKAEYVYKYISDNYAFEEEHTGLQDVLIEIAILDKAFRQHKKMTKGIIGNPWRLCQPKYQEYINTL